MEHLTIEEILEFISLDRLDEESMKLITKVNNHILNCNECFEQVRAFQLINNKLEHMAVEKRLEAIKEEYQKEQESQEEKVPEEGKLEKPPLTLEMGRDFGRIDSGGNGFGF